MLEETLKLINQNLERIAIALEDEKELCKCENVKESEVSVAIPQAILATAQSVITNPIVNTPAPQVPVTQTAPQSFTQEQLAVAMSNAVSAGKMNVIQGILQQLGVQALTQVNPADYNKVATMLKEAGVTI